MSLTYWPGSKYEDMVPQVNKLFGIDVGEDFESPIKYQDPGFGERWLGDQGSFRLPPGTTREQIAQAMDNAGTKAEQQRQIIRLLQGDEKSGFRIDAKELRKSLPELSAAAVVEKKVEKSDVPPVTDSTASKKTEAEHVKAAPKSSKHKAGEHARLKQHHSAVAGDELDLGKIDFKALGINPHDKKAVAELTETLRSMRAETRQVSADLGKAAGFAGQAEVSAGKAAGKLDHASRVLKSGCTL